MSLNIMYNLYTRIYINKIMNKLYIFFFKYLKIISNICLMYLCIYSNTLGK